MVIFKGGQLPPQGQRSIGLREFVGEQILTG